MWPFSSTNRYNPDENLVHQLEDKLLAVQRQVREMQLEWESTYHKLRSILARLNKRAQREEQEPAGEDGNDVRPGQHPGDPLVNAAALQMMRRRR